MAEPSAADPSSTDPSGIEIRDLDTIDDVFTASAVLSEVWGGDDAGMPPNLLRALARSGNYAVGLYDGARMIGASAGFFGAPDDRSMHSHITGVLPEYQEQGLGRLLKQHQHNWALARGVGHITWTFDPLVARNAHFNLLVLGARVTDYLVNHYGAMSDSVNRGDQTDRLFVTWALASPRPGNPPGDRVVATIPIPRDIQHMRAENPHEAEEWRLRVREQFTEQLGKGLVVGGFRDPAGYLLVQPAS